MAGSADDHLSQALQLSCTYEAVSLHESEVSLCPVQDLSENELGKVLKSGLRPREWAMVRLMSKRWKAVADSCADCVNVGLTDAAWFILTFRETPSRHLTPRDTLGRLPCRRHTCSLPPSPFLCYQGRRVSVVHCK